ncbi:hypothetical protein DNU06_17285 [Putridiphycobacter roseus]|uniref:Secretion system C-terminal sorting domain-containing protein n=1 Tax=Putridiphycobacter roseus TaxID=2219161 RepID=A0A2W1MU33_9FLAO|nr:T9SS type A sorting domain-containing protein [Putridiphycobacter roseus]PZE15589.1 hypothetical protein DNU06_17285 [Putridiphycobacter roseus]
MKKSLLLILIFIPIITYSQVNTIEATSKRDLIVHLEQYNGDLYYYNSRKYNSEYVSTDINPEITGNLAYFDFVNKITIKTPIFSKVDSINTIALIIQDNYNSMYTIRSFWNSPNDINPEFFLEKRSQNLSMVLESNQIYLSGNIDKIVSAFFDENDVLHMKGLQPYPSFQSNYYSIYNNNTILEFPINAFVDFYDFHPINDSTYLTFYYDTQQIIYHKNDTFEIINAVDLLNHSHFINEKSVINENTLFINGRISQGVFGQPSRHVVYKHKINSDTAIAIFIDSIPTQDVLSAHFAIDLIDSNYVYSGSSFGGCSVTDGYNCLSSFKIYCLTSDGNLNWEKSFGGDGNNLLQHIYATPDTGCLALFYRYVEEDSARNGDMYWVKYDKYGNEDPDYLSEFFLSTPIIPSNKENIHLFPNPTKGIINFKGIQNGKTIELKIYNMMGQLVFNEKIESSNVDISHLNLGSYIYQLKSNETVLKKGKIIKI